MKLHEFFAKVHEFLSLGTSVTVLTYNLWVSCDTRHLVFDQVARLRIPELRHAH